MLLRGWQIVFLGLYVHTCSLTLAYLCTLFASWEFRYIGFVDNLWKSVVEKDSNSRSLSVFWFLSSRKYGILVMQRDCT